MSAVDTERVLVVDAGWLTYAMTDDGWPERLAHGGFWRWVHDTANERFVTLVEDTGRFAPRAEVETDESRRQIIPYVMLRDPDGGWFTYRRLSGSGESRLRGLCSIGVGGHVNDEGHVVGLRAPSVLHPRLIGAGLHRELAEELILPTTADWGTLHLHGFMALDATPVDRVHLGVVVILDVAAEHVAACDVRERDKLETVGWLSADELRDHLAEEPFEGWSRVLIEAGLPEPSERSAGRTRRGGSEA